MAIAWHPYFNLPSGDRSQVRMHIPADKLAEVDGYDNVFPTGKICPSRNPLRPARSRRSPLGTNFFDDNWNHIDWQNKNQPRPSRSSIRPRITASTSSACRRRSRPSRCTRRPPSSSWPSSTSTTSPTRSARSGDRHGHRHGHPQARSKAPSGMSGCTSLSSAAAASSMATARAPVCSARTSAFIGFRLQMRISLKPRTMRNA
jgi:hypothetical protein